MTRLDPTIRTLTRPHKARIPGEKTLRLAEEPALLDQLEDLKAGKRTGGGAGNQHSSPLSLDPLIIEHDITRTIHTTSAPHQQPALAALPLKPRVEAWAKVTAENLVRVHAEDWEGRIRALLEHYRDLPNIPCPICGYAEVQVDEGDQVILMPALVVRMSQPMVASCRNWECSATWTGTTELINLATTIRRTVVD